MKILIILSLWASSSLPSMSDRITDIGDDSWERDAAFLAGASAVEELSEEVMERFSAFHDKPLDLNAASRGKLLASGLLNEFQAGAVAGYRSSRGDIMSFAELALVPGFTEEYADALRPFVTLRTSGPPGTAERRNSCHTITLRSAFRRDADGAEIDNRFSAGLKYAAEFGERAEFRWSTRTTYDDASVRPGTISAAFYGRRALSKLVVGSYAARFGQGLTQWSGFSLDGFPTVASFRKNGTGISPTGSFTPQLKGVASEWVSGHFTISGALSVSKEGVEPFANLRWTGRKASIGTTCVWEPSNKTATAGADWKIGLRNISLFGELALKAGVGADPPFAGVCGLLWTPSYGTRFACMGRYFAPDFKKEWSGLAIGFENGWMSATADAARNIARELTQYKAVIRVGRELPLDSLSVYPSVRLNARLRPSDDLPDRVDLRGDISAKYRSWSLNGRCDLLWCKGFAWLWYAELGRMRQNPKLRLCAYARFSLFCVDNWDDRIYVYERDAPGTFNVPAYYGRGYSLSVVGALKRRRHAFHLRASWISYPWNLSPKPDRLEMKMQYMLSLSGKR